MGSRGWFGLVVVLSAIGAGSVACVEEVGGPDGGVRAKDAGAGDIDAGVRDAGDIDAGERDAGAADAGDVDAGGDAGSDDAGPVVVDVPYGIEERPANPTCVAFARPPTQGATVALQDAFPLLSFNQPVFMLQAPSDPDRFFVLERAGVVKVFPDSDAATPDDVSVFVDLTDRVDPGASETGLLGLAFHPDFANNGEVYVSYTASANGSYRSRISRFTSADGGLTLDAGSEEILIDLRQPYGNHNGGGIAFGPDGYLYIGFGDGGSAGDPDGNGQNTDTLLGAMLRIDVSPAAGYAIPPDNPFAGGGGAPEIFAWGLRNPWRWSFDRVTGELWAGDVGQALWEEIDVIERGGNYGWKIREGKSCYGAATCNTAGLIDPVVDYSHGEGRSATGGYVYRGSAVPALEGVYIYGDYWSGTIWGLYFDPVTGEPDPRVLVNAGGRFSSFAEDHDGEIYVIAYAGSGAHIYRVVEAGPPAQSTVPERLSETGCFDAADPQQPASGLIPYGVNAPLWSDGADKRRWLAIPDGQAIAVEEDGHLALPIGSVLVKSFYLGGAPVETRLLVRHDDGEWAGYSYAWDEQGSDATLLPGASSRVVGGQRWTFPSRTECLMCHTSGAKRTLGMHLGQLDGDFIYPASRRSNQVATLTHLGLLAGALPDVAALPDPLGDAPLEARARAYLHANCAHCHHPGGTALGDADLRVTTPFASMNLCDAGPQEGDLGIQEARVVAPGDPGRSVLLERMLRLDANRMPDIGSSVIDAEGTALVRAWIESLAGCP